MTKVHWLSLCRQGIFTRYGFWLDLDTLEWTRLSAPLFNPIANPVNAMHSFQGRPTIFGQPECDESGGNCPMTGVEQYDQSTDTWRKIGSMAMARRFHAVVEVPGEWCDMVRAKLCGMQYSRSK